MWHQGMSWFHQHQVSDSWPWNQTLLKFGCVRVSNQWCKDGDEVFRFVVQYWMNASADGLLLGLLPCVCWGVHFSGIKVVVSYPVNGSTFFQVFNCSKWLGGDDFIPAALTGPSSPGWWCWIVAAEHWAVQDRPSVSADLLLQLVNVLQ